MMNIQLGDQLTVTFPRDQVNAVLVALTKSPHLTWEMANPAVSTIMSAAKADFEARSEKAPPA